MYVRIWNDSYLSLKWEDRSSGRAVLSYDLGNSPVVEARYRLLETVLVDKEIGLWETLGMESEPIPLPLPSSTTRLSLFPPSDERRPLIHVFLVLNDGSYHSLISEPSEEIPEPEGSGPYHQG